MRMPFGKHCKTEIKDLPDDYLKWLYEELHIQSDRVWEQLRREYARRWGRKKAERFRARHNARKGYHAPQPRHKQRQQRKQDHHAHSAPTPRQAQEIADSQSQLFQELIQAGYRTLAKQYHPDVNPGDAAAAEKMRTLNRIMETLRGLR
jgi:hypothetical protein